MGEFWENRHRGHQNHPPFLILETRLQFLRTHAFFSIPRGKALLFFLVGEANYNGNAHLLYLWQADVLIRKNELQIEQVVYTCGHSTQRVEVLMIGDGKFELGLYNLAV